MSTTDTLQREATAALCKPGHWARLLPALQRLGAAGGEGPAALFDWLDSARAGSRHEAERALRVVAMRPWSIAAEADGTLTLRAQGQAWTLTPVPARAPRAWQVGTLGG